MEGLKPSALAGGGSGPFAPSPRPLFAPSVAFLLLPLLAALPLPASEIDRRELELQVIRDEISRLQARLVQVGQEARGVAGELARIELELQIQEGRLAEARAARDLLVERIAATEQEVVRLETALLEVRRDLRRRLVGLYRLGRQGYARLLFSVDPRADLLTALRVLRYLVRRDAQAIHRFLDTRVRLDMEQEQLGVQRRQLEAWTQQEEERRQELARLRSRQATLLARKEEERQELAARAEILADKERKLARFLDFLYGRTETPLAGTPIQNFRGVLDWPVAGEVRVGFGPRMDPRYRTQVPHNGVSIATQPGAEVRAVFPGKVLFAAPFEGYGPTVVVHHPGRVFTLYAGLASLKVGRESMLSLNQMVGVAANHLYFEIRVENRPQDPLHWLR